MKVPIKYLLVFSILLIASTTSAQTHTTVQDGNWNNPSTWDANGVPGFNLTNSTVNVNHEVVLNSNALTMTTNSTLNINDRLNTFGNITLSASDAIINVNNGAAFTATSCFLSLDQGEINIDNSIMTFSNGQFTNNGGAVSFNYGRMTVCYSAFNDYTNNPSQGMFGTGTMYFLSGSSTDHNFGNFSTDIIWGKSADASVTGFPTPENNTIAAPFPGTTCGSLDVTGFTCRLQSPTTTDTDNDGYFDFCDLDDDNDGILDSEECGDYTILDLENGITTLNGSTITATTPINNGDIIVIDPVGAFADGTPLEVRITINNVGPGAEYDPNNSLVSTLNHIPANGDYLSLQMEVLDASNGDVLTVDGEAIFRDIDSDVGNDFTEVFGVLTTDNASLGANLTALNYLNGGPGAGQNYYGVNPATSGNINNWSDEANVSQSNQDHWITLYFDFVNQINLSFGVTGSSNSSSGTRDLGLSAVGVRRQCDYDGDGVSNIYDLDSDNDGCFDTVEAGHTDGDNNGIIGNSPVTVDTNGQVTGQGGYTGVTGNETIATQITLESAPTNQNIANGNPATFQADLSAINTSVFNSGTPDYSSGTDSSNQLTYQWQENGVNLSDSNNYTGVNTAKLVINNTTGFNGNTYTLVVNHSGQNCSQEYSATLSTFNPCDPVASGYPDSDGDGISDACDLDMDNDGILDETECPPVDYTLDPIGGNFDQTIGSKYRIFTYEATTNSTIDQNSQLQFRITSNPNVTWNILESNRAKFEITEYFPGRYEITVTGDDTTGGGVYAEFKIRTVAPVFEVVYNYFQLNGAAAPQTGLTFWDCTDTNTALDNPYDFINLDSDGDNCFDALEGDAPETQIGYTELNTDGSISGSVDANGITSTAAGGQGLGTSTNSSLQSDECSPCNINNPNYADTDGDLIGDFCDLDDDNDGILDTNESCRIENDATAQWDSNSGTLGGQSTPFNNAFVQATTNVVAGAGLSIEVPTNGAGGLFPEDIGLSTGTSMAVTGVDQTTLTSDDYFEVTFTTANFTEQVSLNNLFYRGYFVNSNGNKIGGYFNYQVAISTNNFTSSTTILPDTINGLNGTFQIDYGTESQYQFREDLIEYALAPNTTYAVRFYIYNSESANQTVNIDDVSFGFDVKVDTDNDGMADCMDLDSDNDGCLDVVESGGTDANGDGILDGDGFNTDGQVTTGGAITDGYDGVTGNEVVAVEVSFSATNLNRNVIVTDGDDATFTLPGTVTATSTTDYTGTAPNTIPDYSGASATDVSAGLNYQWYQGDPDAGGTLLTGETSLSLTINSTTLADNGTIYSLLITHDDNSCFRQLVQSVLIVEPDLCDPASSGYVDSDGDGISDYCDLDDDNDGILDVNEGGVTTQVFNINNVGDQYFTVPANVTEIEVKIWGAGGGGNGGAGGFVYGVLPVTPGEEFSIMVGHGGNNNTETYPAYGFNGPRVSSWYPHLGRTTGGGLAGIFTGTDPVLETDLARAIMIAGGGGAGYHIRARGGNGGDTTFGGGMPTMLGGSTTPMFSGSGGGGYNGGIAEQNRLQIPGQTSLHGEGGSNYVRADVLHPLSLSTVDEASLFLPAFTSPPYSTDISNGNLGRGSSGATNGADGRIVITYSTQDSDGDGVVDRFDLDSDNDGIVDAVEAGHNQPHTNGIVNGTVGTDGVPDMVQTDANSGLINYTVAESTDDSDTIFNFIDIDSDGDGIPDNVEAQPTIGYIVPSGNGTGITDINQDGIDDSYATGLATLEDTDGDNIPDYLDTDTDNDGTPDIQENGDVNTGSNTDGDTDGLDDNFDAVTTLWDTNDELTTGDLADLITSFLDTDGDIPLGGDLDFRDVFNINPPASASIDFDGINDYLDTPSFMAGWSQVTMMAWVKLASDFSASADIMGENMFRLRVISNREVQLYLILDDTDDSYSVNSNVSLPLNEWHHVAITYDGSSGNTSIYIDGELEETQSFPSGVLSTNPLYADPNFAIGRFTRFQNNYFKGAIDEVRVFNTVIPEDQIQRMVYQEIEQNGSNVRGALINKDIVDTNNDNATLPLNSLQGYWPMTNILSSKTTDYSGNNRDATLYNITTVQPQTAPMPFQTVADGAWTAETTWLHGDVWDIEDVPNNKDWAIVNIDHNVSTPDNHTLLGLTIDDGVTLTVNGDKAITNTWYLELNGTLNLTFDSQLIQTENSDLVTSAAGKILRRQEGNANSYWYNYWTSPVGSLGATSLSDNNGTANNTNNTPFNLSMLKEGNGDAVEFTSEFADTGMISDRWLYSFQNGITYWDWTTLTPTSAIQPGVGYTQKGMGNPGLTQQYLFEGKPNNGTILIAANDVDGDAANESEQDVTLTTTMVGNPYPSALDADEFIRDNIDFDNGGANPIISGTILLWEQWAGSSHWLAAYEGGYGYINLTGTARAYQHPDIPIADQTQTQGIKTPTKFIPVGQGFFVEVINDGNIEFNNSQRVFKNENAGESVFFREESQAEDSATEEATEANPMQTIKLEFSASNGATRHFVLGFSDQTTDNFDYGYDGGLITQSPEEDMCSLYQDKQFAIQAFSPITEDKVIDLALKASGSNTYTLDITEINNVDENQDVFLKDNRQNLYWNLTQDGAYHFSSEAGQFNDRFDIVFKTDETLSNNLFENNNVVIYMNNIENKLFIKGLEQDAKSITLVNMLGQNIKTMTDVFTSTMENGISIQNLSSGVYIVDIKTEDNNQLSKKIILE